MWHVSFLSGVATLRTATHLLLTYLLTDGGCCKPGDEVYTVCDCLVVVTGTENRELKSQRDSVKARSRNYSVVTRQAGIADDY